MSYRLSAKTLCCLQTLVWAWLIASKNGMVFAHHGHEHHETPPAPSPVAVVPTITNSPPPAVVPPAPTPQPVNLNLPLIAPLSTILPVDISGMKSGAAASFFQNPPKQLSKAELKELYRPDNRYQFLGQWILFAAEYKCQVDMQSHFLPVAHTQRTNSAIQHFGKVEHLEKNPLKSEACFMPTEGAKYFKLDNQHLRLDSGAVLVRAANETVYVSTRVNGEEILTKISGGALVLVSSFDQRSTVLSLTDRCCGALSLFLPSLEKSKPHKLQIKPGQIAEVYPPSSTPNSNLVATKVEINERLPNGCGLLLSQCHYIRAFKKFNLKPALPEQDLAKVLKTAAAVAYIRK